MDNSPSETAGEINLLGQGIKEGPRVERTAR